jgi:hypothetical protein
VGSSMRTWRITTDSAAIIAGDQMSLSSGLRYHLAVAPLYSAIVQIGDRQQAYVTLEGCSGCAIGHCVEGCRTDLFRRVLSAAQGGGMTPDPLELVRGGLKTSGYQQLFWVWPARRDAPPLRGDVLAGWSRARMVMQWGTRRAGNGRISTMIALGGETAGPPIRPQLAAWGWATRAVPPFMLPWASDPHWPLFSLSSGMWHQPPWLMLPTAHTAPGEMAHAPTGEQAVAHV